MAAADAGRSFDCLHSSGGPHQVRKRRVQLLQCQLNTDFVHLAFFAASTMGHKVVMIPDEAAKFDPGRSPPRI
jgi:hypothetical protein